MNHGFEVIYRQQFGKNGDVRYSEIKQNIEEK